MKSHYFRYGFLAFFLIMFFLMLWNTYLVFAGAHSRPDYHAAIQAAQLVRLLPDGYHDAADLQSKARKPRLRRWRLGMDSISI